MRPEDEQTIPHVTRHDNFKTGLYVFIGIALATVLIGGTIWLFISG